MRRSGGEAVFGEPMLLSATVPDREKESYYIIKILTIINHTDKMIPQESRCASKH